MDRSTFNLDQLKEGETVIIKAIDGGREARNRLINMGIIPGAEIYIEKQSFFSPVILRIGETKLMIGRGLASKIKVHRKD